jgi:hypothetical protein
MEEVQTLCHRIAIMREGRIQCLGTPAQLKRKYGDGWRLVLQCARDCVPLARDWVASLPAVAYSSFLPIHGATRGDSIRGGVSPRENLNSSSQLPQPGFEIPLAIETTLAEATPCISSKVKLEFVIPRLGEISKLNSSNPVSTSGTALCALIQAVKTEARSVGVTEWSIDTCTLEDVFLRVTTGSIAT